MPRRKRFCLNYVHDTGPITRTTRGPPLPIADSHILLDQGSRDARDENDDAIYDDIDDSPVIHAPVPQSGHLLLPHAGVPIAAALI